ncbi:MAG TPA: hypothetical protein PLE61_07775 [Vicinamibacterales bacterium]|nr:hypothetical protein [Vicinamibacterales bacterium]HPW20699.1 hypothetical protein [Vicinamibacterales bacterium]
MNKLATIALAGALVAAGAAAGAYLALREHPAGTAGERLQARAGAANEAGAGAAGPAPEYRQAHVETVRTATAQLTAAGGLTGDAGTRGAAAQASGPSRPSPVQAGSSVTAEPSGEAGVSAADTPGSEAPAALVWAAPDPRQTAAPDTPAEAPVGTPEEKGPAPRTFEEFVVPADSVLGIQLASSVSSEVARVEDPVEARVIRDVLVGTSVAIPAGTRIVGSVIAVERGGKLRTSAKIGVRFHTLVLGDGTRVAIDTASVSREGKSPGKETAAKVGGAAIGGAILGGVVGGRTGALIGGAAGAAGGTAAQAAGGRNPAVLASGTVLTIRLREPATVVVER